MESKWREERMEILLYTRNQVVSVITLYLPPVNADSVSTVATERNRNTEHMQLSPHCHRWGPVVSYQTAKQ